MITVNNAALLWRENFTMADLLDEVKENKEIIKFQSIRAIVIVNGEVLSIIEKKNYIIRDGDEINILPLLGGG